MAVNRYYSSTAAKTALNGGITNSATSILVNALTGYPVSTPWTAILDRDTATEEVVTVTSVSGLTATVIRGVDGTSGVAHSSGGTFEHGVSARDFTEPQAHIAAVSGVHGLTGSVVGDSDIQTLSSKTLASPAFTGTATGLSAASAVLDAASTLGGVTGTSLAADRTAWTTYTPTFTNCTSPTGSFAYKQSGKSLRVRAAFTGGTATGAAQVQFSLPAGLTAAGTQVAAGLLSATAINFFISSGASNFISQSNFGAGNALSGLTVGATIEVS